MNGVKENSRRDQRLRRTADRTPKQKTLLNLIGPGVTREALWETWAVVNSFAKYLQKGIVEKKTTALR